MFIKGSLNKEEYMLNNFYLNEPGLLTQLNLYKFRLLLDDIIKFIASVSESNLLFDIKEVSQSDEAMKFAIHEVGLIQGSRMHTKVDRISFKVHYDINTHIIEKCDCILNKSTSTLNIPTFVDDHFHQKSKTKIILSTREDLLDASLTALCPCLCLIRTLIYISRCSSFISPTFQNQMDVLALRDVSNPNKIVFKVKGSDPSKCVYLKLETKGSTNHLTCHYKKCDARGMSLPSFQDNDNDTGDSDTPIYYIEHAFAYNDENVSEAVPHKRTSQALRHIFGLLGLDLIKEHIYNRTFKGKISDGDILIKSERKSQDSSPSAPPSAG
jgi:hypothetical protein